MVEGISVVTLDVSSGSSLPSAPNGGKVSVFDVAQFESIHSQMMGPEAVQQVSATGAMNQTDPHSHGFRGAMELLNSLNSNTETLGANALGFSSNAENASPGEILKLTMDAHHFLFKSEMTANVASKTSDGIQQLFRQQS